MHNFLTVVDELAAASAAMSNDSHLVSADGLRVTTFVADDFNYILAEKLRSAQWTLLTPLECQRLLLAAVLALGVP